ncbi:molybdopterin-dependent oxidoreductase [Streptomyces sp. SID3212]|uniref:molybdopterin-dependent oxidoreductase n=1 Tax=Streptomyces sp. SID3212 TaxID=2690259 RepID=UPI001F2A28C4|nr:molybdopterin-dependent oxidoreductase [Streptomyces sp. SID3212]
MSRVSTQHRTASTEHPTPHPAAAPFLLRGEVARTVSLTVTDLRERWASHRADVVFHCTTDGPRHHTFEGALLRDVIAAASPDFGGLRRKDRTRYLLAVTGGDGHHTVLSWAEVDADFGNVPILLATSMDGRGLDAEGSQLVVPSDHCGARYVSAITSVWLGAYAGPPPPPPTPTTGTADTSRRA